MFVRRVGLQDSVLRLFLSLLILALTTSSAFTSSLVESYFKISDPNFPATLNDHDQFGCSVAYLPDLGDVLAIGAHQPHPDGTETGEVWITWVQADSVLSTRQIKNNQGGFPPDSLTPNDNFGISAVYLGNLGIDAPTPYALAVGAQGDDGPGNYGDQHQGAVWILFLDSQGTVQDFNRITEGPGGLPLDALVQSDNFGVSVAYLGDLGPGAPTPHALAVGEHHDNEDRGAVWILFLNPDGTIHEEHNKIDAEDFSVPDTLDPGDAFGRSVASLGDIDQDGVGDLAVGAVDDDDGGTSHGAVWILFLNQDGTIDPAKTQKISSGHGGFPADTLHFYDQFGSSVSSLGDLNYDGVNDLAVGAIGDDDGGADRGAVWVLMLNSDGTVDPARIRKISSTHGGFTGNLSDSDAFGVSLAQIGDLDNDGVDDVAVGAHMDDDAQAPPGTNRGAVWLLYLEGFGACCYSDGGCEVLLADECAEDGGTFLGEGSVCDPNPCVGACYNVITCECFLSTEGPCTHPGGLYHAQFKFRGLGTNCDTNPDTLLGACCFPDGCIVMSCGECRTATEGYGYSGPGTTCSPNLCPLSDVPEHAEIPIRVVLSAPVPNPLKDTMTYSIGLPSASHVQVQVFDVTGKVVSAPLDRDLTAGTHAFTWVPIDRSGGNLPSGVYYMQLRAGDAKEIQKFVLTQ